MLETAKNMYTFKDGVNVDAKKAGIVGIASIVAGFALAKLLK